MSASDKALELEKQIKNAQLLASLEGHPAWDLVVDRLREQIRIYKDALCQIGLSENDTARMRYEIRVMEWCIRSTKLATPEQYAKWEGELAFQRKREKMLTDMGLNSET